MIVALNNPEQGAEQMDAPPENFDAEEVLTSINESLSKIAEVLGVLAARELPKPTREIIQVSPAHPISPIIEVTASPVTVMRERVREIAGRVHLLRGKDGKLSDFILNLTAVEK